MEKRHFLWLIIIFVVFGVSIAFVFATRQPNSSQFSEITFNEYIHDFGVVEPEDRPQYHFTFRNTGESDLVISKVKPSCGCTAVLLSNETIKSGGHGEIEVSLNPQGRRGKQELTVAVHSNAKDQPIVNLTLQGRIKATVAVSPERIFFGSVNNQETHEKRIRVLDSGDGKLRVLRVETTSSFLTAEALPRDSDGLITYEVKVLLHSGAPAGQFKETLTIHSNDAHRPRLDVSIEGNVLGPITVSPEHLFFGFVSPGEVAQREILLTKAEEATLQVLEVGHQSHFVSVKIIPIDIGRKVQVQVQLSPNTPSGPFRDILEIYTNNADQSVIQVPLHALVRK